jgi:thiol-disulfide isomerase/thioredoxin
MRFRLTVLFPLLLCLGATGIHLEKLQTEDIHKLIVSNDITVLNFWATWCEPCVEEIPVFTKIQNTHKRVTIIGISMDELKIQDQVQSFARKHSMNYRVAIWTGDDFEQMVNSIDPKWDGPIPATFIFKKGRLAYSKTGPVTVEELTKELKERE